MPNRLNRTLTSARSAHRKLLIPYVMGGDPHPDATPAILDALVTGGSDIIELGFPFSDPMADGPTIQAAALRALASKTTLAGILEMVQTFRAKHADTPLVLMGYANPLYSYGLDAFCADAGKAGVDGLLIVDLPPEEADDLAEAAAPHDLALIRLVTPTTDAKRLQRVLEGASGYLYYVSITGVTGTASANSDQVGKHLDTLRQHTDLPIAIGFGIKTPEQAAAMATHGDAVVIGSALVELIAAEAGQADKVAGWLASFRQALDDAV